MTGGGKRFFRTAGGWMSMKIERPGKILTRIRKLVAANLAMLAVLAPMAATMILAWIASRMASDGSSVYGYPVWSIFGDGLPILLLLLAALGLRSRLSMAAATVLADLNLLIKIFALVLYREAFMSIDFRDVKLLLMHTDGYAIRAVLGPWYALWLIPAVLAVLAAVVGAGVLAWRKLRDIGRRARIVWLALVGVLLALSVWNIGAFLRSEKRDPAEVYTGHLVRPLPVSAAYFVRDAVRAGRQSAAVPLSAESRKILEAMEVVPPRNEPAAAPPEARFDRIIIIALESVDLEFIRAVNPRMPENATPNLDRLMTEYPAMTNFFCSSQPTSWGLTGILLSRLDFMREQQTGKPRPSLFGIASANGYFSCYISPMTGVFAENRRIYGEIFSPDRQYFLEDWMRKYGMKRDFAWGISDRELYSCALREMRSWGKKRFVVLISTLDTHPPYTADGITEAERERFPTPFLRALHMADRHLGAFLKELMADRELYDDRTLVVITSDHTATHGENYLKRKQLIPERVPLIFVTPARSVFARLDRNKYASGIDLAPTLVNFIGGRVPESFMGRDLFGKKNIAISWMSEDMLLIRSPGRNRTVNIAAGSSDPEERALIDFFRSHY